jgi:response regulator RpfG family c-di-GMP phosphodiesterase
MNIKELKELCENINILYVEDNIELLTKNYSLFDNIFSSVTTAINGNEALEEYTQYFEQNNKYFDLVITDINMPYMNGLELANEINKINKDQVLIALTAYNDSELLETIINTGFSGYINKSFNTEQLINSLSKPLILLKSKKEYNNNIEEIISLNKKYEELNNDLESQVLTRIAEVYKLNEEIKDTQKEVVFTMGAIGESRSKETAVHVRRVAEYSEMLALYYGLPKEEAAILKEASPMHDIGKVAIPDNILNKPGILTPDERKIMNTHTTLGYEMLKNSKRKLLKVASLVAYEHHERWDGKGYPRGLKGKDISIYGRITALADVFDALGSNRVYKKAWDDDKIFKMLKSEKGKQFEPKLIDIFFNNLDKFLKVRDLFVS